MKSAHRAAARAKRARTHIVTTYGLLDTLFAAPVLIPLNSGRGFTRV